LETRDGARDPGQLAPHPVLPRYYARPEERSAFAWAHTLLRFYLGKVMSMLSRTPARHGDTPLLLRYFWDTIEACAPPARVLDALGRAGFAHARRHVEVGVFSEYTARR